MDKPFKVFDMKKFQQNMNRELKRPFPDRHKVSLYQTEDNNFDSTSSVRLSSNACYTTGCVFFMIQN